MMFKLKQNYKFDFSYFSKNSFWITVNNVINILTGLGISIVFTRIASKEVFGQYNFLISILGVVSFISMPGTKPTIFRAISKGYDGTYQKGVRFMFRWCLLGIPIIFFIGIYLYYFYNKSIGVCIIFTALIFPVFYSSELWTQLTQAKQKFKIYSINISSLYIIRFLCLLIILLVLRGKLIQTYLTFIISTSILNTYFYCKTNHMIENDTIEPDWKKSCYKLSIPSLFAQIYDHLDKIILMAFFTASDLAIYSVAIMIGNRLRFFMGSIIVIYLPQLYRENTADLIKISKKNYFPMIIFSLIIPLGLIFLIPYLITVLFSDKYVGSIFPAQIYLTILPFYFITSVTGNILIKDNKEDVFNFSLIISGLVNLITYIILIPYIGVLGGVIGSMLYFMTQAVIRVRYILKNSYAKQ